MSWRDATALARAASAEAFGRALAFTPDGGTQTSTTPSGAPLLGVFRSSYESIDLETGAEISSQRPNVRVSLEDFATPPGEDDLLDVAKEFDLGTLEGSYRITATEVDGEGGATLLLHLIE